MPTPALPPHAFTWPPVTAPLAQRHDHVIEQLGRTRNDPYAWMKYIPRSGTRSLDTLPAPLHTHLATEMKYAEDILSPLAPLVAQYQSLMHARAMHEAVSLPADSHGWHYGHRVPEGATRRVFYRISPEGQEQILFNEAERAASTHYYRATDHQPSPDDRYFAWAEDVIGDDRHQICIYDAQHEQIKTIVPADAFGYGGFTFSASSKYLFWIWRNAHSRPTRLYRTTVDTQETVLIYEEHDPAMFMQLARTAAGGFIALTLAGPETSEVRVLASDNETGQLHVIQPRHKGISYEISEWAGRLLMLTNADGALDRKLLAMDPNTFVIESELVPHCEGVSIISVMPFAAALVTLERENGQHRLVLRDPTGAVRPITFDEPAYVIELVTGQAYDARKVRFVHQTPASPPRWIDLEFDSGNMTVVAQTRFDQFDPQNYRVERLYARAPDGEQVPVTVLSRCDMANDTRAPLLLTGYGAYGISSEPAFSLPATVLVDAGFRYAIAHVRGGSEKGRRWFLEGRAMKKKNSMTDFIACANHLVQTGYTDSRWIVAHGLSAGGLLVAGAMNIAPTLWAGVIAQVPFVDMLNTMSDADHPLVPLFRPDWGDPLADPDAYDYIASISPYENVQVAPYPPVLCTAGLKDDRVPYWEPAKLLAHIRHCSTSGNPAILQLDLESGHQSSSDQGSEYSQAALFWAFAQQCVQANGAMLGQA
ncbi:peptidase S9 [Advenella kashmirensis W13003]|uniref:Peptidase S9 n=1 Tax=Advenella kashmirensis W13003 TaxID=1424334 RepID=V8QUH3_9BURK|nr:prolyl oligopeptidase family serine peptidase [Advenella kashmirensis]ETF02970.1 peptidase S9 [Advenella kashmirensis W13003]